MWAAANTRLVSPLRNSGGHDNGRIHALWLRAVGQQLQTRFDAEPVRRRLDATLRRLFQRRVKNRRVMTEKDWRETNRALWDERVAVHLAPGGYDVEAL